MNIIWRLKEPVLKQHGFFFITGKERIVQPLRDPNKPYSMTQIRAFYSPEGCDFVYYLRYVLGLRGRYRSPAWLGQLIHTLLQQAYHGVPLLEAHRRVWRKACGLILDELERWYALDEEYYRSGRPHTKARALWTQAHPEYAELQAAIEAYRDDFLAQNYIWAKTTQLSAYYRWSRLLLTLPRAQLFLPHARLVEGQPLYDEYGAVIDRFADPHDKREHYRLLSCEIAGLTVVGAPDYVAIDPCGRVRIADAKVMSQSDLSRADIAEDAQLNLYVAMLRQSGWIEHDQPTEIGHMYYTRSTMDPKTGVPSAPGTYQVWAPPSPDALPRLEKQLLRMDRRIKNNEFLPVRGIATGSLSPCPTCAMADACRTHLKAYMEGVTP
jgi:hypothetical protein